MFPWPWRSSWTVKQSVELMATAQWSPRIRSRDQATRSKTAARVVRRRRRRTKAPNPTQCFPWLSWSYVEDRPSWFCFSSSSLASPFTLYFLRQGRAARLRWTAPCSGSMSLPQQLFLRWTSSLLPFKLVSDLRLQPSIDCVHLNGKLSRANSATDGIDGDLATEISLAQPEMDTAVDGDNLVLHRSFCFVLCIFVCALSVSC